MISTPVGCNAIKEMLRMGYLRQQSFFADDESDATDWLLTFSELPEDEEPEFQGEQAPIATLNYCPFCGTRMMNGKPQCGGYGRMSAEEKEVP